MFCSFGIVADTHRNKILLQKIKIHRRIYIRLKQRTALGATLTLTHTHFNKEP